MPDNPIINAQTWKTRIELLIQYAGTAYSGLTNQVANNSLNEVIIELVQNVRITERSPRDIIHSIDQWNQTTVVRPHEFSWSFEVPANSEGALLLRNIQRDNKYFDLLLQESENLPASLEGQFVYVVDVLGHAWVENRDETFPNVGIPRIVFSGRSLRSAYGSSEEQVEYGDYPYTPEAPSTAAVTPGS